MPNQNSPWQNIFGRMFGVGVQAQVEHKVIKKWVDDMYKNQAVKDFAAKYITLNQAELYDKLGPAFIAPIIPILVAVLRTAGPRIPRGVVEIVEEGGIDFVIQIFEGLLAMKKADANDAGVRQNQVVANIKLASEKKIKTVYDGTGIVAHTCACPTPDFYPADVQAETTVGAVVLQMHNGVSVKFHDGCKLGVKDLINGTLKPADPSKDKRSRADMLVDVPGDPVSILRKFTYFLMWLEERNSISSKTEKGKRELAWENYDTYCKSVGELTKILAIRGYGADAVTQKVDWENRMGVFLGELRERGAGNEITSAVHSAGQVAKNDLAKRDEKPKTTLEKLGHWQKPKLPWTK